MQYEKGNFFEKVVILQITKILDVYKRQVISMLPPESWSMTLQRMLLFYLKSSGLAIPA